MGKQKHNLKKIFVVMAINGKASDEIYHGIIKPAVEESGLDCVRSDDIHAPGVLIEQIHEYLRESELIIAVLTGQNLNVPYEVGFAIANNQKPILLAQSMREVPSDLKGYRIVLYNVMSPKDCHETQVRIKRCIDELLSEQNFGNNDNRKKLISLLPQVRRINNRPRTKPSMIRNDHKTHLRNAKQQKLRI